jgi:Flp pilus assembly protein TadD
MTHRILAGAGLSLLLLGGAAVGTAHLVSPAAAGARLDPKAEKKAAATAEKARKAMAKTRWDKAIALAEAAVALAPEDAGYRQLMGSAYLKGGRFASAEQAFADVLTLQSDNGAAALNLALAQVANGRWDAARTTLDAHAQDIPAADRGLALALAGDPVRAVAVLTEATRLPDADAKTRQNLALAMALGGQWQEARALAALDLPADQVDTRLAQWAAFARPAAAADQVAALLGVVPAADPGQPVAIALAGAVPVTARADVDAFMPGAAPADAEVAATETETASDTPATAAAQMLVAAPVVTFAAPREVVQPLPAAAPARVIASGGAYKTPLAHASGAGAAQTPRARAGGDWFVQVGAYENEGVARADWARATRRFPALAALTPAGMTAKVRGGAVYRLSVGGFARRDADALCRGYRASGGICFVRTGVGEQTAGWAKRARVQVAAR